MRGGPAKVAVAASALMGTVSGSAVANVVASGTFTIPLMKRSGLRPAFAAAVEAAASSGGQIMPPVMGAAAFIMMEILGVPYTTIMAAALIPGLLYFLAVLAMVDFEVGRQGIPGIPRADLPDAWAVFLRQGHLFLPLLFLIFLLVVVQYTPVKAAFYGVLSILVVPFLRRSTWFHRGAVITGLRNGGIGMLEVAAACACAGIIVGMLMLSGLALRLSGLLIELSGGNLSLLLVLTMIVSIILGMGMPTSAVYVILATMVVPAIVEIGVDPLAAHLFVFYFGVMSNVTPPVAIAAYAAAGLAGATLSRAGVLAFRLALAGFVLPFMWVYNPALLMLGEPAAVVWAVLTAVVGIVMLAGAVQGFAFVWHLRWHERVLLLAAALTIIKPGLMTDAAGAGLAGLAALSVFLRGRQKAARTARPQPNTSGD
jgi:TRAP transporter 4TM/12TM fusion protein